MRPEAEVRDQLIEAVTFEARLERAVRVAEEFSRAAQSGDFAAVARSRGLTAKETPLFTRSTPPPDLAPMQAAQAMAFSLPVGQVSPPVRERIACFVMKVNEHQVATSEDFARERESIMAELLYRKRQETFTAWYEELRASARIEDRREALLASAESDEEMDEEEDSE
jgi:parvulin-like peptidyl-prolyl isomerase